VVTGNPTATAPLRRCEQLDGVEDAVAPSAIGAALRGDRHPGFEHQLLIADESERTDHPVLAEIRQDDALRA
jgi:hypothetical protein